MNQREILMREEIIVRQALKRLAMMPDDKRKAELLKMLREEESRLQRKKSCLQQP